MGGITDFANWYKRRVNRILPSVLAVAFLVGAFFPASPNMLEFILRGDGWFISCIMLYYIAIFFIGSYLKKHLLLLSSMVFLGTSFWFYYASQQLGFSLYGGHYIRWLLFFLFMLLGAKVGMLRMKKNSHPKLVSFGLIVSVILYYAFFILGTKVSGCVYSQNFSVFPLLFAVYFFYRAGSCNCMERIYQSSIGNFIIRFIGGLCLEIYLVQFHLFTDRLNGLFPINIIVMFVVIFVVAYLTRCFARIIGQTFKDDPYDWKKIIALY